jgi:chromosome segregation ATPase
MMAVDDAAIMRFRAVVANRDALTGAVAQVERTLNDWRQTAMADLRREIAIVERSAGSIYVTVAEKSKQRLAQLRSQVVEVEREIDQLTVERDRLQERRAAATQLACRCRDYLREQGALPHLLEF